MSTWTLTYGEYFATAAKIAAINERAAKRGFTGRLEISGERKVIESTNPYTGLKSSEVVYVTEVTGEAPSYGGWTFLARIDRLDESFVVAAAPGVESVDRSLVRVGECDHCGADRRRNNTYLVVNEQGEVKNVGSTCIKDFLGWSGSVVFLSVDDAEREIGESLGGSHFDHQHTVQAVLINAYAAIRAFGFVPTSSYTRSTADVVRMGLGYTRAYSEKDRQDLSTLREYAAEATEQATLIEAFIASDDFAGTSTYVENLKTIVAEGVVGPRQIGIVSSAPQAYARHLGQVAEREAREAAKSEQVNEYLGNVKDKITVTGTVSSINYIQGDYGTTVLYTIITDDKHLVKWFASREALGDQTDVHLTLTGTVKKHEEYNGSKSTVLTRCKQI